MFDLPLPLKLEPADRIVFAGKNLGDEPANATLKITNPTGDRMAFKIRCTCKDMFRIRPVIGVVKPKEDTTVSLVFKAYNSVPESGKHYIVVYAIKATDETMNGRATWQKHTGDPEGLKKLYVYFEKESEEDKEEDKKGEEKKDEKKDEKKADEKKEDKKEPEKDADNKEPEKKQE